MIFGHLWAPRKFTSTRVVFMSSITMHFFVGEKVSLIWPVFAGASWWFRQGQRRGAAVNGVADLPMKKRCQPLQFLEFTPSGSRSKFVIHVDSWRGCRLSRLSFFFETNLSDSGCGAVAFSEDGSSQYIRYRWYRASACTLNNFSSIKNRVATSRGSGPATFCVRQASQQDQSQTKPF